MTLGSVTSCAVNAEQGRWKMTESKPKKTRRSISKLRLYKALRAEVKTLDIDEDMTVYDFMELMKDEVIDELVAE
jgi:hypothetical protein